MEIAVGTCGARAPAVSPMGAIKHWLREYTVNPESAKVDLGAAPESSMVSLHVRLPMAKLAEQMSVIARLGASATVHLRGSPERIVSFVTSLSGRFPALSAQIGVSRPESAATSLSGKSPVR